MNDESPRLVRALGPGIAVAVVVGSVIGSGIFYKPGNVAADVGQFGVIVAVWLFGGVLCLLGALCFAELATMYPQAGGVYVYLRETFGPLTAFLFGWCEFLFAKPAAIGALSVAFVGSFSLALGVELSTAVQLLLVALLISILAWVNVLGVVWGGRLQFAITLVKAGFLAFVAALPFLLWPFAESIDVGHYASTTAPRQSTLAAQVGAALLAVMWAYHGWHAITPLAEEVRDPQRNIPFALFAGIGLLTLLYVSANVAYHGVLSMAEMAAAQDHAAERMLQKLFGQAGLAVMSAVIMCSTFGAINSNLLEAPRVTFAMGRDGVFFRGLGQAHVNYHTPAAAIVVTAALSIGLVVGVAGLKQLVLRAVPVEPVSAESVSSGGLSRLFLDSLRNDTVFGLLTNFVVFASNLFYALCVIGLMLLRRRRPDAERPYRTWGYPGVPIAFLVINAWFLWQVYRSKPVESLTGLALIGLGVPMYYGFRRWQRIGRSR